MRINRFDRKIARWLLLFGLTLPAGAALADAAPSEHQNGYFKAAAAAQRGDYVIAYCFWRPLAEQGDAEAQYALGWMYHNGYGLVSDDQAARMWWEKAVAQGHVESMFSLGTLYSVGSTTIERNYVAAMKLWARAANAGNEHAQFALRELAQRNLAELRSLTRMMQGMYPHILDGSSSPSGNIDMQMRGVSFESSDGDAATRLLRHSDWVTVAVGYPPSVGWAATRLIQAGGVLLSAPSHQKTLTAN